jgi:hypothetical protein
MTLSGVILDTHSTYNAGDEIATEIIARIDRELGEMAVIVPASEIAFDS